jgi:hypothetical protein
MRSRFLFPLLLVLVGVMFFAACSPGPESQPAEQPSAPEPVEGGETYPAPDVAQPVPDDAYPAPPDVADVDPYPGVGLSEDGETTVFLASEIVPLPGDKGLNKGTVFVEMTEVVLKESFPVQVGLILKGDLPTPCNALRVVVSEPDDQGNIELEVYSVVDPDKMCVQVLSPFETVIPLGDYTEGRFTVLINGEPVTEFEIP